MYILNNFIPPGITQDTTFMSATLSGGKHLNLIWIRINTQYTIFGTRINQVHSKQYIKCPKTQEQKLCLDLSPKSTYFSTIFTYWTEV